MLLNEILSDSKAFGGYDVIIDDGGHTVSQMLTSISVRSSCRRHLFLHLCVLHSPIQWTLLIFEAPESIP